MCQITTDQAARDILAILVEAGASRTGDELLRLLAARGLSVCEDHAFTALHRLLGEGKIEIPDRTEDEDPGEDLRSVPFALHREGQTPILDGRWKLLDVVSRGGTSVVYRAEQVSLSGRIVVVKLLSLAHLDLEVRQEVRTRFLREAGLIARLNHPAAVTVLDQGVEGDRVYYVMEYLEGGTLADRLAQKGSRLSWEECLEVATQVTEVLAAAVRMGILHRDIKPANIMYDGHGRLKVVDWGLAKVRPSDGARVDGPAEISKIEAIRGTPAYMAPERCEGRPGADDDERGDIYALGMVLRRLLTGQDPYPLEAGQNHLAWLNHQIMTVPPRLLSVVPEIPRGFSDLVDVCIRKRPEDRFQTFSTLHAELRRISSRLLRRTTKVVRPPSTRGATRTGLQPSRAPAGVGGVRPDTGILEFVDGLEFDTASISLEFDAAFNYVAAKPDLLCTLLDLAHEQNAVRWAASIWAQAEEGREPSGFEAAYKEALRDLETSGEPGRAALAVPLNLCDLAWVALRKVHQAATAGELGDTTALEGLLAFLREAVRSPKLAPWRVATPPGTPPSELPEPPHQEPSDRVTETPAGVPSFTTSRPPGPPAGSASPEDRVGEKHGDYRLKRYIGRGGTCDVYEAEDERLGRRAAVKVLRPQPDDERGFIARYVREARNAANLPPHAHLVPIYAALDDGRTRGIAMEYVEGRSLEEVLEDGSAPLPWREALRITSDAAMGLGVAHQAGFIHRDVKPGNLMIEPTGRARVMDFGLLRRAQKPSDQESESVTTVGIFVGTPQYASPEQCEGLDLDARSDVFSLGVTLYEMLAGPGRRPFTAPTTLAQLRLISDPKIPAEPLRPKNGEVPREVETFVHRMLAKTKEGRPPSMAAVVSEIDAVLGALDERALARRRARRRLVGAGILVLVGLAALAYAFRPGKTLEERPLEFELGAKSERGTAPPESTPKEDRKPSDSTPVPGASRNSSGEPSARPPAPEPSEKPSPVPPLNPPSVEQPAAPPAKFPYVNPPGSENARPSPSREEARTDTWMAGYRVSLDELQVIRKTLAVLDRRDSEIQRHVYADALSEMASVRKDPRHTSYTLLVLGANLERLRQAATLREAFLAKLKPDRAIELRLTDGRSVQGIVQEASETEIKVRLADPGDAVRLVPRKDLAEDTYTAGAGPLRELLYLSTHGKPLASIALLRKHLDPSSQDDYVPELLPHAPGLVHAVALRAIASLKPGDHALAQLAEEKLATLESVLPANLRYTLEPRSTISYEIRAFQALHSKRYEEVLTDYAISRAYPLALAEVLEVLRAKATKERLGGAQFESWEKVPFETDAQVRGKHIFWMNEEKCWVLDQPEGVRRVSRTEPRATAGYVFEQAFSPAPLAPNDSSGWVLFLTDTALPEHYQVAANEGHLVLNRVPRAGGEPTHVSTYSFKPGGGFHEIAVVPVGNLLLLYHDGKPAFKIAPEKDGGIETRLEIALTGGQLKLRSLKTCPLTDE